MTRRSVGLDLSRRRFLQQAGATSLAGLAFPAIVPASVRGGAQGVAPSAGFDYDFWLGPAPFEPHRGDICSADSARKTWWFNSDYALGFVAGWGVHPLDIASSRAASR